MLTVSEAKGRLAGLRIAIEHFKRGLEEGPQHALAYSGLAGAYIMLAAYEVVHPSDATAHRWYALYLRAMGRLK